MLMTPEEKREITKRMRSGTYRGDHYGDYWTPEEDAKLRILFGQGYDYVDIAIELGRSEQSVINRCAKLKLNDSGRKPYEKRTCDSCLCTSCSEYPNCSKLKEQPKND